MTINSSSYCNNNINNNNNNNNNKYDNLSETFKFIDEFEVPLVKDSNVKRFVHKESGITLLLNHIPGPKCNANIVVPTESINNKGLPHTLEHLIFTGCNDIPYREFLEVLSNRCFSAPSNAYTSEDHTCYSLESVGPEGILHYLPLYLKFILSPTLKENDFITEVYHLDSNGKDQGVVLCEMQARENTVDDLLEFNMCKNIFKGSGYQYSYGGLTNEIATLTNEMVRDYHGRFYIPKFMTIIIQGCIDSENLFKVLDKIEFKPSPFHKKEETAEESEEFVPWKSPIPPLLESKSSVVPFPSESDTGSISIGWRGPSINDIFTINALSILLRYFQDNSSSPLNQRFTNKSIPLASSIYGMVHEVKDTKITIEFSGVPVKYKQDDENTNNNRNSVDGNNGNQKEDNQEDEENESEDVNGEEDDEDEESNEESDEDSEEDNKEEEEEEEIDEGDNNLFNEKSIYNRLIKLFKELREKGFPEKDTMKKIIDKEYIKTLEGFEEDPLGTIFSYLLTSAAFPLSDSERKENKYMDIGYKFKVNEIFNQLKEKPDEYWFDLLDQYFINAPYVEIILKPDSKLSETIAQNTIQRQKDICEKYGEEGMKEYGEKVKNAIESNKSFPEEYYKLLPQEILDIKKIPLPKLDTQLLYPYTNENPNQYAIQKVLVNTHFLHLAIVFHIQDSLPDELRPYLTLFQLMTYETDLLVKEEQGERLIPYKEVSKKLSEEVLSYEAVLGFSNSTFSCSSPEIFRVTASCQREKFDRLLYWVLNMIFNFHLTPKRLLTLISSIISNLNDVMNDSTQMLGIYAIYNLSIDKSKSNDANISVFKQKEFLRSIQSALKGDDEDLKQSIIDNIKRVRNLIVSSPESMFVQVSSSEQSDKDFNLVEQFVNEWNKYLNQSKIIQNKKRKAVPGSNSDDDQLQRMKSSSTTENNKVIPYFSPLQRIKTRIPSPLIEQLIIRGSESNNLLQYVPLQIDTLNQDFPAVNLLCNIFNSKEGEIRKKGYAYSHSLTTDLTRGCLVFCLIESASPIKALQEFYKWLKQIESNPHEIINKVSIETAVCVEIYDFYSTRSSSNEIIVDSYINVFKGLKNMNQAIDLLNRFKSVTFDQIIDVYNRYFKAFLNTNEKVFLMLSTNPSSNKQIELELKESLNCSIISKYPSDLISSYDF